MADLKRVFARRNAETEQLEWFFAAREGLEGPFSSEALAEAALQRFIQYCQFESNRVFMQPNPETGEEEWFFVVRDGIEGPFATDVLAAAALCDFIEQKKDEGSDEN